MSDWISVKDALPPDGVGVLVAGKFIDVRFVTAAQATLNDDGSLRYWNSHCFGGTEWEFDFENEQVTHWMALPEPPSEL